MTMNFVDWDIPASYEIRAYDSVNGPYSFWLEVQPGGHGVTYWDDDGSVRKRGRIEEDHPLRVGDKAPTIVLESGGHLPLAGRITKISLFVAIVPTYYDVLEAQGQRRLFL